MLCVKCKENIDEDSVYCKWCGKKQVKTAAPKALKRPNGAGTVYKLSGRRRQPWVAAMEKEVIGYYPDKTSAMAALEAFSIKGFCDGFNDTLEDVYERWKSSHFRDIDTKGQEGYEMAWRRLEPLWDRKMRTIKVIDFQKIIDEAMTLTKSPKPLSRSGKEKIKQLCSQLCKQAIQDEIINRNYGEFIKLDKQEKVEKEIFSKSDIEKLFGDYSQTAKIICTLIYTGFRINELFSIKRTDVNLEGNYMTGGEKTEAGKNRIVPIHEKVRPFIEEWYDNGHTYLVTNPSGCPKDANNFRNREYYPLLEKLNIDRKNPHCTRHTFASLMSAAGVRPEVLQKIIGHANYSTTANIYIHNDINELQKAMEML